MKIMVVIDRLMMALPSDSDILFGNFEVQYNNSVTMCSMVKLISQKGHTR